MAQTLPSGDRDRAPPAKLAPPLAGDGGELRGRPLGRILIKLGKLNRTQVGEALELQRQNGQPIGQILVGLSYVREADVKQALTIQQTP